MKISVAMATYNRSAMVREAIGAAMAQTAMPDEIVVTDDASTDDTWETLTALAAENFRLRVFRREQNSGGVENWNDAVRQTRGEYIAWCSDDDRFLPGHLEASVAYLERHPEIGLVHSSFVDGLETDRGTRMEPRRLRWSSPRVVDRAGLLAYMIRCYDWPFHPSTIVVRRKVWEAAGPFDARWELADTDWFLRVVEQFPAALLPVYGVVNRRHPGNWSNRMGSARMQREIFQMGEESIERVSGGRVAARAFSRLLWRANVRLRLALTLRQRLKTGHTEAACAAWKTMLSHTGRTAPQVIERVGAWVIRRWCARKQPLFQDSRQSVSPL